jgi:hypothetical protein
VTLTYKSDLGDLYELIGEWLAYVLLLRYCSTIPGVSSTYFKKDLFRSMHRHE